MSYEDGWAAINLEMPSGAALAVLITEHWGVIKAVTGLDVHPDSPGDSKRRGALALMEAWNFDFRWSTLISDGEVAACSTDMGHSEYAEGGVDPARHRCRSRRLRRCSPSIARRSTDLAMKLS